MIKIYHNETDVQDGSACMVAEGFEVKSVSLDVVKRQKENVPWEWFDDLIWTVVYVPLTVVEKEAWRYD